METTLTLDQMFDLMKFNRQRLLSYLLAGEQPNDVEYQDYYFTNLPNGLIRIDSRITGDTICLFTLNMEA